MSFAAASRVELTGDGRFTWQVPDGWQQGKGAFGGLILGALTRAMQACEDDRARRLRAISADLCAPVLIGPVAITTRVLRRGRGATYLEAQAHQDDALVARASTLVADGRPPARATAVVPPPAQAAWAEVPVAPMGPPAPTFTRHFEYRTTGPGVFAGAAEPVCAGWIRPREPLAVIDAAAVIALLDAWWPCALAVEPAVRGMTTVAFAAELLVDPATLDPATPFAYRAHLAGAADGFFVELRHLWQGDRLVGLNQQTFASL